MPRFSEVISGNSTQSDPHLNQAPSILAEKVDIRLNQHQHHHIHDKQHQK
jgi:hypothetical protein